VNGYSFLQQHFLNGGDTMNQAEIQCHARRLTVGALYWDAEANQVVEFGYMGQTGYAIVYEPGDSGGGMQSSWAVEPGNLERLVRQHRT
jgi:hypothetical protein